MTMGWLWASPSVATARIAVVAISRQTRLTMRMVAPPTNHPYYFLKVHGRVYFAPATIPHETRKRSHNRRRRWCLGHVGRAWDQTDLRLIPGPDLGFEHRLAVPDRLFARVAE